LLGGLGDGGWSGLAGAQGALLRGLEGVERRLAAGIPPVAGANLLAEGSVV
jgi:hypothetical protein